MLKKHRKQDLGFLRNTRQGIEIASYKSCSVSCDIHYQSPKLLCSLTQQHYSHNFLNLYNLLTTVILQVCEGFIHTQKTIIVPQLPYSVSLTLMELYLVHNKIGSDIYTVCSAHMYQLNDIP